MIVLRNKNFSGVEYERMPYYTTKQRIGNTAAGFGFGAGVGAVMGGMAGGILGGKTGAKIGATIGGIGTGSLLGKFGWDMTGKRYVDAENKRRKKLAEQEEVYRKNPRLRYKSLEDPNLEKGFRDIEKKYNVKYGDDFYKYLKLRKKLVPILVDLEKRGIPVSDRAGLIMEVNPSMSKDWVDSENSFDSENMSSMLAINPEMADDTWLTYNFKTGKYGYDPHVNNFPNLKSLLLDKLKDEEEWIKESDNIDKRKGDLEFIKKYRDLINREL